MPFTLAHPAAVLPIHRMFGERLSLSALAIGSMAPDLPYFIPIEMENAISHSFFGIVLFWIPLGLAIYFFFHLFLSRALLELLPFSIFCRLRNPLIKPAIPIWLLSISIVIGASTHLVWDAFTHANTLVTSNVHFLNVPLLRWGDQAIPMYRVFQYLFSIFGLGIILFHIKSWMARTLREPIHDIAQNMPLSYRAGSFMLIVFSTISAGVMGFCVTTESGEQAVLKAAVWSVTSLGLSVIVYSLIWNIVFRPSESKLVIAGEISHKYGIVDQ